MSRLNTEPRALLSIAEEAYSDAVRQWHQTRGDTPDEVELLRLIAVGATGSFVKAAQDAAEAERRR